MTGIATNSCLSAFVEPISALDERSEKAHRQVRAIPSNCTYVPWLWPKLRKHIELVRDDDSKEDQKQAVKIYRASRGRRPYR